MEVSDTLTMTKFPVTVNSECQNLNRIYPLKQKTASAIYGIVSRYPEVKRATVFGSSVTAKCHIDSDMDICIDVDQADGARMFSLEKEIGDSCDWNCDILIYHLLGNSMKKTIDQEGVNIYERAA